MNRYSFRAFSQKTIYLARKRGIKITNKNIEQLRSAFISRRCREEPNNIFTVILKCTYEDSIQDVLSSPRSPFIDMLKSGESMVGAYWTAPVVLGPEHGIKFDE